MRSDLPFLIDRAEGMADRLEGSIGAIRSQDAAKAAPSAEISAFRPANRGASAPAANPTSPAKTALSRALAGLR